MKTMQESLSDGDGQSELTLTICEVWLSWEEKLRKFLEGQSGLQEGQVGRICVVLRNEWAARGGRKKLRNFLEVQVAL